MDYEDSQFINTIATASDKEQEIRHLKIELAEAQVQMNRLKELNEEDEQPIQCPIETTEKIAIPKAVLKIHKIVDWPTTISKLRKQYLEQKQKPTWDVYFMAYDRMKIFPEEHLYTN